MRSGLVFLENKFCFLPIQFGIFLPFGIVIKAIVPFFCVHITNYSNAVIIRL